MKANREAHRRFKTIFLTTVLVAAGLEGTVLAQQYHLPTGRDAFLKYQVGSTDELIAALKKDPLLRQRYARHFGISQNRVIDFVKNSLVVYRLPKGRWVTNYGVTPNGYIFHERSYLKAGTRVWATRSGLPVLKWACANPLTKELPGTLLGRPSAVRSRMAAVPSATAPSNELAPVAVPIDAPLLLPPVLVAPDTGTFSSNVTLPPALTGAAATVVPPAVGFTVPTGGGGRGPGILPFLPIAFLFPPHHGGGGGGTNVTPTPTPTPPEVIPTPTPTPPEITPTPTPMPTPPETTPTPTPTPVVGPPPPPNNTVPEPGSFVLLGFVGGPALLAVGLRRRCKAGR